MTDFDYNFNKFRRAKSSQVSCCLRGLIFDNWVRQFLEQNPQATVIEIGAGRNTRFERIDHGRQVYWFDLDLPDVIANYLFAASFMECLPNSKRAKSEKHKQNQSIPK